MSNETRRLAFSHFPSLDRDPAREHRVRHVLDALRPPQWATSLFPNVSCWPIVLQKSKVAAVQIFGENLKRKEVDDSLSLSRATEVAYEFGARR